MAKKVTLENLATMVQQGLLEAKEEAQANKEELLAKLDANTQAVTDLRAEFQAHREENSKRHAAIYRTNGELVTRIEHEQLKVRIDLLENQPA